MSQLALVIDDEPDIRNLIALSLDRIGLTTHTAANFTDAKTLIDTYNFDVCLTDMCLPDGDGVAFVKYLQKTKPDIPIAVITAHGNINSAVEAMKNGAFDFVSKPVDINLLRKLVTQAISAKTLPSKDADTGIDSIAANINEETEIVSVATAKIKKQSLPKTSLETLVNSSTNYPSVANTKTNAISLKSLSGRSETVKKIATDSGASVLIGRSAVVLDLRSIIDKASKTNAPVYITGEPGAGKELIARLIHNSSPRSNEPFIAVRCRSIPAELMESEIFGHTKESIKGAHADHDGFFKRAQGGTIYLEDVDKITLTLQAKLLRTIQERITCSIGGIEEPMDVRILSASSMDIITAVETGEFRNDLYYRLNLIGIKAPSLREHASDVPIIAQHILKRIQENYPSTRKKAFSPDGYEQLTKYDFPGNVDELENIIERAFTLSESDFIETADLNLPINCPTKLGLSGENGQASKIVINEVKLIKQALSNTRWNRKAAAIQLGITYRQLRYRLQRYGIDEEPTDS